MEWTYHCGTIKVGLGIAKSSRPANFLTSLKSLKEVACAKKILTANALQCVGLDPGWAG